LEAKKTSNQTNGDKVEVSQLDVTENKTDIDVESQAPVVANGDEVNKPQEESKIDENNQSTSDANDDSAHQPSTASTVEKAEPQTEHQEESGSNTDVAYPKNVVQQLLLILVNGDKVICLFGALRSLLNKIIS